MSEWRHVNTIPAPAVVLRFVDIPVGVFGWTAVCPEEIPFLVHVIKPNPQVGLLLQKQSG